MEKEIEVMDITPDGVLHENGHRYPRKSNIEGNYEYDFAVFDVFVALCYDQYFKGNPKMCPFKSEEQNIAHARQLLIRQVDTRKLTYRQMAEFNRRILSDKVEPENKPSNHYLDSVRRIIKPSTLRLRQLTQNFSRSLKDVANDERVRKAIRGIEIAAILSMIGFGIVFANDQLHTNVDEFYKIASDAGLSEAEIADEFCKHVPKNDGHEYYFNASFPSTDQQMIQATERVDQILDEKGTRGVIKHFLELSQKLENGETFSDDEIRDFYATGYSIVQSTHNVLVFNTMNKYSKTHPDSKASTDNLTSITFVREAHSPDYTDIYQVSYKDGTRKYIFSEPQPIDVKLEDSESTYIDTERALEALISSYGAIQNSTSSNVITHQLKAADQKIKKSLNYYLENPQLSLSDSSKKIEETHAKYGYRGIPELTTKDDLYDRQ